MPVAQRDHLRGAGGVDEARAEQSGDNGENWMSHIIGTSSIIVEKNWDKPEIHRKLYSCKSRQAILIRDRLKLAQS